ncbi:MAG TPA: RES family NAD+ phosphorylase [Oligoflexus sp.]|uniref:RES family NAD+ phosphorylase n=1 Tax=Oligoflexus sp. TaxID=1971216 RepID=UPI002D48B497|nr:RES family NAD+ phosphorylase [Oligoflexus sp.]HYX36620.1 RES family NAD+ phosphorylase [Oligoflexus sp.]
MKRQISTQCQKKFANLPDNLGILQQGKFCRGAYLKYSNTPLGSGPGTGRFWSDKHLDSPLYFSSDEYAVFPERRETGFDIVEPHFRFWATVDLENVLDLTSANVRKLLKITKYEVEKIEWSAWKEVPCPTQILGRQAFDAGYEAIIFNSVRHKGSTNLAIFAANLNVNRSSIVIQDSHGNFKNGRIP